MKRPVAEPTVAELLPLAVGAEPVLVSTTLVTVSLPTMAVLVKAVPAGVNVVP